MKHKHLTRDQINAQGGNTDMFICATWKVMLDLANMVLYENAEDFGHDQLLIFDTELNKVLKDYSNNKDVYKDRLEKMHRETGLHVEIIGGHVFTVDDTDAGNDG